MELDSVISLLTPLKKYLVLLGLLIIFVLMCSVLLLRHMNKQLQQQQAQMTQAITTQTQSINNLVAANEESDKRMAALDGKLMIITQDQKKLNSGISALKASNKNVKDYLDQLIPSELSSLLNSGNQASGDKKSTAASKVKGQMPASK